MKTFPDQTSVSDRCQAALRVAKQQTFIFLVLCFCAFYAEAVELPLIGKLPQLGRGWSLQKQGAKKEENYEYSWATYTNSMTGDRISFAADKFSKTSRAVGNDPTRQAAIDMFPGGLPRFMEDQPGNWVITDTVRFSVVELDTGADAIHQNVQAGALEYTFVYENETHSIPNRLAHGYVLAFGDTCVFIQHTATRVITSEDVRAMTISVLRDHLFNRPKQ